MSRSDASGRVPNLMEYNARGIRTDPVLLSFLINRNSVYAYADGVSSRWWDRATRCSAAAVAGGISKKWTVATCSKCSAPNSGCVIRSTRTFPSTAEGEYDRRCRQNTPCRFETRQLEKTERVHGFYARSLKLIRLRFQVEMARLSEKCTGKKIVVNISLITK